MNLPGSLGCVAVSAVVFSTGAMQEAPARPAASAAAVRAIPAKPASHTVRTIEGWTVRIDDRLLAGDATRDGDHALRLLANRLYEIAFILPADKVARLRQVPIQIDLTHGELRSAQYHPSRAWLVEHGYSADLERTVHIPDAREWSSHRHHSVQPWSVLHELAHAYHDQVLGFDEPAIKAAWEKFRSTSWRAGWGIAR